MNTEKAISFPNLGGIEKFSLHYGRSGDDYIFAHLSSEASNFSFLNEPVRVSGLTVCLVLDGSMTIRVGTTDHELRPGTLLTVDSRTVVTARDVDRTQINAYVLFISMQFMRDINIDMSAVNMRKMVSARQEPIVSDLDKDQLKFLSECMNLLYLNAKGTDEPVIRKNIARSLIQTVIYHQLLIRSQRISRLNTTAEKRTARQAYVQEFMQQVQQNFTKERSLLFYADRLCITPKYLSRIIKEETGISAADWLDRFVVSEAKNMLRFSNKNIQQIAYTLNFPSQSAFGKFFKHMTGMSPSDYQKT